MLKPEKGLARVQLSTALVTQRDDPSLDAQNPRKTGWVWLAPNCSPSCPVVRWEQTAESHKLRKVSQPGECHSLTSTGGCLHVSL